MPQFALEVPSQADAWSVDTKAEYAAQQTMSLLEALSGHFTHVLVDEASQALESEELLPLSFAGVGCVTVSSPSSSPFHSPSPLSSSTPSHLASPAP